METRGSLVFLAEDSPPPRYGASVGGAEARSDLWGEYEERELEILDGRRLEAFDLDREGFRPLRHASAVADFYDERQRARVYEAQCRELVAGATGAVRTHVFDHTLRSDDPQRRERWGGREPSAFVHCDYTPRSAPRRVRGVMGEEADDLLRRPFAIFNVWRPIATVESSPLALCDARTMNSDRLVPAERRARDRIGEIYMVRYGSEQRWVYFPHMTVDEVLLIKTYDSREDGRARWCAHTAFDDPRTRPGAPARESIETRVFAFYS